MKIEGAEKGVAPVQRLFCLKEKNQNKINSYHTITGSSTPLILQSNVYVLLDVGTMPSPTSIHYLWKAFNINSRSGDEMGSRMIA
jgi:chitin synthase